MKETIRLKWGNYNFTTVKTICKMARSQGVKFMRKEICWLWVFQPKFWWDHLYYFQGRQGKGITHFVYQLYSLNSAVLYNHVAECLIIAYCPSFIPFSPISCSAPHNYSCSLTPNRYNTQFQAVTLTLKVRSLKKKGLRSVCIKNHFHIAN